MRTAEIPKSVPVSVAIPAYRNEASLRATLNHIADCSPLPQEILLHCDGGWEVPADVIAGLPVPVRVVHSMDNLGPGGGRHRLYHEAACEIIASFDDDSWPLDREYFAQAIAVMEAFPKVAVMSPAVYLREKPVLAPLMEASKVRSFEGSASVTRKSMYVKLPGYVPVPAAYGVEEADLSLQIHAAGFEILSCPWMRAWHDRPYADNQHTVQPWIRNEVLLAYLRFPRVGQAWGWIRAVRHVWRHRKEIGWRILLRELAQSLPYAVQFQPYVRRYSLLKVWQHHRQTEQRFVLTKDQKEESLNVRCELAAAARRVLFIQYTNPGGYPPLEYSAHILARAGWDVEFCGIVGSGAAGLDFAPHPRVKVRRITYQKPGLRQKLHYIRFILWCALRVLRWRPHWVYASDALSTPAAGLIRRLSRCRLVYHEHDSPVPGGMRGSWILKQVMQSRAKLGKEAEIVVLPNQKRLDAFVGATGRQGTSYCVWNCPEAGLVPAEMPRRSQTGPLRVMYHGSIVPDRFGTFILEALACCACDVHLSLIGYFPLGETSYRNVLLAEAERLGLKGRFDYLGPMSHHEILECSRQCDAGLALLRIHEDDINMKHMIGASNKPFDYASQGLALIVPPDPEWEGLYVQAGCAMTCPMGDKERLVEIFRWMAGHRDAVAAMGAKGHAMALSEWHYERQFAPVLAQMQAGSTGTVADKP